MLPKRISYLLIPMSGSLGGDLVRRSNQTALPTLSAVHFSRSLATAGDRISLLRFSTTFLIDIPTFASRYSRHTRIDR
jgi:hypothetical protein